MPYTKQQLIQAFCQARQCTVDDLPVIEAQIQRTIDVKRARIQSELDKIPVSAKAMMKSMAIEYLNKLNAEQTVAENYGVSL